MVHMVKESGMVTNMLEAIAGRSAVEDEDVWRCGSRS